MLLISIFLLDLLVPAILYVSKRIILLFTEKKKKVVKILALIYIREMCTVQSKCTSVRASVSRHACIKPCSSQVLQQLHADVVSSS